MISFSPDARVAELEMRAILFVLVAFAHIDGTFDPAERSFIRDYVDRLVERRADEYASDLAVRGDVVPRWKSHFYYALTGIEAEIRSHFTESVAQGESSNQFVFAKLKLRCFELLERLGEDHRAALLAAVDDLMRADGVEHPSERLFRDDLVTLFSAPPRSVAAPHSVSRWGQAVLEPVRRLPPRHVDHPFFQGAEHAYSNDPATFARQAAADLDLMRRFEAAIWEQRARGQGKLAGARSFAAFAEQAPFLDGHVHVVPPKPGREYEIIVLGDLHGCYACLKAALMQSDFFAKVEAHRADPAHNPETLLVLLGDYIDRGRYSYDGVLRTALRLFLAAPEHVFVLRGNHEHYVELGGKVQSPVRPAEAIASIEGLASREVLDAHMRLFELLPSMVVFDRILFVHAGIPRQDTISAKLTSLSALNDPDLRLEMSWSDPSDADHVPLDLQKANTRFPFGKEQFKRFMSMLGCSMMIRGHERVVEGIRRVYDAPEAVLLSLFSAGGATNEDLPPTSNYREVTPMALSIRHKDGSTRVTPFPIEYQLYNDPARNAFFQARGPGSGR